MKMPQDYRKIDDAIFELKMGAQITILDNYEDNMHRRKWFHWDSLDSKVFFPKGLNSLI